MPQALLQNLQESANDVQLTQRKQVDLVLLTKPACGSGGQHAPRLPSLLVHEDSLT